MPILAAGPVRVNFHGLRPMLARPTKMRIEVYDSFPAAHRIRIDDAGTLEPVHVHHWRARVCFWSTDEQSRHAVAVSAWLATWVAQLRGRCINDIPPFDVINPTAEEVARHLAAEFGAAFTHALRSVTVGEAAGFSATYLPDQPHQTSTTAC